jgi:hypothetical protein
MGGEAALTEKPQRFSGIDRSHAPDEDTDLQSGVPMGKRKQKLTQGLRTLMWAKPDIGIEIPTDDPDGMLCLSKRLIQCRKISRTVD